ncbi:hypothetical protein SESBI_03656 [Sesbania bispinosa]|nr:hypothetical protein SESBI_03656 [Sesbania bispinosa]
MGSTVSADRVQLDNAMKDVAIIRRDYVCKWVLHPLNEVRRRVLAAAHLPDDLSFQ